MSRPEARQRDPQRQALNAVANERQGGVEADPYLAEMPRGRK